MNTTLIADYGIGYDKDYGWWETRDAGYLGWDPEGCCESDRCSTDAERALCGNCFDDVMNRWEIPDKYKDSEWMCVYICADTRTGECEARLEGYSPTSGEFVHYIP